MPVAETMQSNPHFWFFILLPLRTMLCKSLSSK